MDFLALFLKSAKGNAANCFDEVLRNSSFYYKKDNFQMIFLINKTNIQTRIPEFTSNECARKRRPFHSKGTTLYTSQKLIVMVWFHFTKGEERRTRAISLHIFFVFSNAAETDLFTVGWHRSKQTCSFSDARIRCASFCSLGERGHVCILYGSLVGSLILQLLRPVFFVRLSSSPAEFRVLTPKLCYRVLRLLFCFSGLVCDQLLSWC